MFREMATKLLAARGYSAPEIRVLGPRQVVACSHKVVRGQVQRAEALGLDVRDAEANLVKLVTRP